MGQSAVGLYGVVPGLEPVQIERCHVEHILERESGGIAVAAIAQAFDVGTVNHVAAERQAAHRVAYHLMDGVESGVGTLKSAGGLHVHADAICPRLEGLLG